MSQPTTTEPQRLLSISTGSDQFNESEKHGTCNSMPVNEGSALMPPPPVSKAASILTLQDLRAQLRKKDTIIRALEARERSHIAAAAEKAKEKKAAKMNKGWRKYNTVLHTQLCCSEPITQEQKGNIVIEKGTFVSEYRFAFERVKDLHAEAEREEARLKTLREEQMDAYRKTQELLKLAEEMKMKVAIKKWKRIAESSAEIHDLTIPDKDNTGSDGDVDTEQHSIATASKATRQVLKPPKQGKTLSKGNIRPNNPGTSQPKRERCTSVEESQPKRLRLSQPKREEYTSVEESQPKRLRLSQPKSEKFSFDSDRVLSGRVLKASAKARK